MDKETKLGLVDYSVLTRRVDHPDPLPGSSALQSVCVETAIQTAGEHHARDLRGAERKTSDGRAHALRINPPPSGLQRSVPTETHAATHRQHLQAPLKRIETHCRNGARRYRRHKEVVG